MLQIVQTIHLVNVKCVHYGVTDRAGGVAVLGVACAKGPLKRHIFSAREEKRKPLAKQDAKKERNTAGVKYVLHIYSHLAGMRLWSLVCDHNHDVNTSKSGSVAGVHSREKKKDPMRLTRFPLYPPRRNASIPSMLRTYQSCPKANKTLPHFLRGQLRLPSILPRIIGGLASTAAR